MIKFHGFGVPELRVLPRPIIETRRVGKVWSHGMRLLWGVGSSKARLLQGDMAWVPIAVLADQ